MLLALQTCFKVVTLKPSNAEATYQPQQPMKQEAWLPAWQMEMKSLSRCSHIDRGKSYFD